MVIVPESDWVVSRDWIEYCERFPEDNMDFKYPATGIDLAISEGAAANYTAMVSVRVYGEGKIKKYLYFPT